jgi:diguanylate cyclase (GGDEF)-like protein
MVLHRHMLAWLQPPREDGSLTVEQPTRVLISRTLVVMCAVGATLVLVTTLASDASTTSKIGVSVVAGIAFAAMIAISQTRRGLTVRTLELLHYGCQVLAGAMVAFTADAATPYAIFFLWLGLHAAYVLRPLRALAEIVFGAACYALGAIGTGDAFPFIQWSLIVGSTVVFGTLTALIKVRVNELLGRLFDVARTDALTGLLNQRAFAEELDRRLERARSDGAIVCLLMADADRFKDVNDRLGHLAGDDMLEGIGELIRAQLRAGDDGGRIGGEEFAVVLPGMGSGTAVIIAERLRSAVEERFADAPVPVTLSFGAAEFPLDGHDVRSLMNAADRALYRAKAEGRNRVASHRRGPELARAGSGGAGGRARTGA